MFWKIAIPTTAGIVGLLVGFVLGDRHGQKKAEEKYRGRGQDDGRVALGG